MCLRPRRLSTAMHAVHPMPAAVQALPLDIVYEDNDCLVVNKVIQARSQASLWLWTALPCQRTIARPVMSCNLCCWSGQRLAAAVSAAAGRTDWGSVLPSHGVAHPTPTCLSSTGCGTAVFSAAPPAASGAACCGEWARLPAACAAACCSGWAHHCLFMSGCRLQGWSCTQHPAT